MALPRINKLPEPEDSALPNTTTNSARSTNTTQQRRTPAKKSKRVEPQTFYDNEGLLWAIDPKTNKKYRVLEGASPEAIKAGKGGFGSINDLRNFVDEDVEGFDIDDLNGTAETFLAHLRVPPNKEEMEKMRKMRALRQKQQDEEYANYVREDDEKDAARAQEMEEKVESRMEKRSSRWGRNKDKKK